MILYIFCVTIVIIMLIYIYIRIKYKFWAIQPVFHIYDFYYWFINVGIIRHDLPVKNKYVNFVNITTEPFENINTTIKTQITRLIQFNYYRNNENKFYPKQENIDPYFIGHNAKTFWSYFTEQELFMDNKNATTIKNDTIIGIITSRPLHVKIKTNSFDVYYVDYLCVNKKWRKKNIAPQLIQTHEYKQSHNNKQICISLFKREEELTGIIPLTIYKTYCFNMNQWIQPSNLHSSVKFLTCDKQNIHYFYDYFKNVKNKFDIYIFPDLVNLFELISTKNIFITMLLLDDNIISVYIFRKTCIFIENKEIISCIASINTDLTNKEFIQGFKIALWNIMQKYTNFKYLAIENISNNNVIIDDLCLKITPVAISPMAYFFYNFAYQPFKSNKCFIIN